MYNSGEYSSVQRGRRPQYRDTGYRDQPQYRPRYNEYSDNFSSDDYDRKMMPNRNRGDSQRRPSSRRRSNRKGSRTEGNRTGSRSEGDRTGSRSEGDRKASQSEGERSDGEAAAKEKEQLNRPYLSVFGPIETNSVEYRQFLRMPRELYVPIIRAKFEIQDHTGAKVYVPYRGERGDVVVMAETGGAVKEAANQIFRLSKNLRYKQRSNYVIRMNLNKDDMAENIGLFKKKVNEICPDIPDDWYRQVDYIELCRMVLLGREYDRVNTLFRWFIGYINENMPEEVVSQVGLKGIDLWTKRPPYSVTMKVVDDEQSCQLIKMVYHLFEPLKGWGVTTGPRFWQPKITMIRPPGIINRLSKEEVFQLREKELAIFQTIPADLEEQINGIKFKDMKILSIDLFNLETNSANINVQM